MKYYTYKIQFIDGYFYIGSRKWDCYPKWDKYWGSPKSINKEKWNTTHYRKEVLEIFECEEECSDKEEFLINEAKLAEGSEYLLNRSAGKRIFMTPDVRKRISDGNKGRKRSVEVRRAISERQKGEGNYNFGRDFSAETRRKLSESKLGERHPNWGKNRSKETRRKISEAQKGEKHHNHRRSLPDHHKQAISKAMKGVKKSPEHRKKLADAGIGRPVSVETRRKTSQSLTGKRASNETKKKMSEAHKGRVWITDGVQSQMVDPSLPLPEGWRRGRPKRTTPPKAIS